ncbi:MAG: efflux RND transporter periplasmic adaptor subunit [Caulobacterales bacterium]
MWYRALAAASLANLAALAASCGGPAGAQNVAAPLPEVGVVEIIPQAHEMSVRLAGRVSAIETSEVRPQIGGIIRARRFEEGATVRAGQVLYEIDPGSARAELSSAQAAAASARARYDRSRQLVSAGAVSQQQVEDTRAEADQAAAVLDNARINLSYTRVTAPISGIIGASNVTAGALATPGQAQPFAVIQNIDRVYVDMTISSAEFMRLRQSLARNREQHARVRLILPDGSDYTREGVLQFSEVTVNQNTGSVRLRAAFPNSGHVLLPGMFVQAKLIEGVNGEAIVAPQRSVTRNARGEAVAMVLNQQNIVEQRVLETGGTAGNQWIVLSGLNAGDRLIIDGLQHVRPGAQARPVDADTTQPTQEGALQLRGRNG